MGMLMRVSSPLWGGRVVVLCGAPHRPTERPTFTIALTTVLWA